MLFQSSQILEKLGNILYSYNKVILGVLKDQKEPKINLNQYRTLKILHLKKARTAFEIAEILNITPPSMATNIEYLSDHKFLKQIEDKDNKRQKILTVTIKGKLKIAKIGLQLFQKVKPAGDLLTAKEKVDFLHILTKIEGYLQTTQP
jgi:DNA-binding MarR family transcriptional regulator